MAFNDNQAHEIFNLAQNATPEMAVEPINKNSDFAESAELVEPQRSSAGGGQVELTNAKALAGVDNSKVNHKTADVNMTNMDAMAKAINDPKSVDKSDGNTMGAAGNNFKSGDNAKGDPPAEVTEDNSDSGDKMDIDLVDGNVGTLEPTSNIEGSVMVQASDEVSNTNMPGNADDMGSAAMAAMEIDDVVATLISQNPPVNLSGISINIENSVTENPVTENSATEDAVTEAQIPMTEEQLTLSPTEAASVQRFLEGQKFPFRGFPAFIFDISSTSHRGSSNIREEVDPVNQVIITVLPNADGSFKFNDPKQKFGCYFNYGKVAIHYTCEIEYELDESTGIIVLPLEGPPPEGQSQQDFQNDPNNDLRGRLVFDNPRSASWINFRPTFCTKWTANNLGNPDTQPIAIEFGDHRDDKGYPILMFSMHFSNKKDHGATLDMIIDGWAKHRHGGVNLGSTAFTDNEKETISDQQEIWRGMLWGV